MSKENKSEDFLDKISLHQSEFYKDSPRSEVVVYLDTAKGLVSIGSNQDRHGVARDSYNYENELADMFDSALNATRKVSFAKNEKVAEAQEKIKNFVMEQDYTTDLGKLNETLEAFSHNRVKEQEAFQAHCVWTNAMRSISMQYAESEKYDVKAMEVFTAYLTDLAEARVKGKNLDEVPLPNDRLSFLDKLSGKSYTWGTEALRDDLRLLTDEQAKKLASQIEAGFPSKETCEFYGQKYNEEAIKYRREFPQKLQEEMRRDILNALTMRAAEDALKGKYFDMTGDMAIFMDEKEKAKFDQMSFADMKKEYGLDLLKTYKGAAMIETKLAEAKEKDGETLGNALDCLEELLDEKRKSYYCPDVSDEVQYRLLKGVKKSYQKFGAEDMKFREVFGAMSVDGQLKQKDINERVAAYQQILDGKSGKIGAYMLKTYGRETLEAKREKLQAKQLKQKKFFAELAELSSGKADITKVKETLKARQAAMKKEAIENTGFEAAHVVAEHALEGYGVSQKAFASEKEKISKKREKSMEALWSKGKSKGK